VVLGVAGGERYNGKTRLPLLRLGFQRLGQTTHTQFTFEPLPNFSHRVIAFAVGQDHTAVVNEHGELYTFGLNTKSQLGYAIERAPSSEEPIQATPRRVAGALKKEAVRGVAASRLHTACFTEDGSVFTWGTNNGQLGYSSTATPIQPLPRKVTVVPAAAVQIVATEVATLCLLSTSEVFVLHRDSHYKIQFPFNRFPAAMNIYRPREAAFRAAITKISGSGNSFVAISELGDLFSWTLDEPSSTSAVGRDIKPPQRIWDFKRNFTAVADACASADSIILCTRAGHVFIRSRRSDVKGSELRGLGSTAAGSKKLYKFTRIPYLQRVVKVSVNPTGAYAAIRCDVALPLISTVGRALGDDLLDLLPHFLRLGKVPSTASGDAVTSIQEDADDDGGEDELVIQRDIELVFRLHQIVDEWDESYEQQRAGADVAIELDGKKVPAHRSILAARSPLFADLFKGRVEDGPEGIRYDPSPVHFPTVSIRGCSLFTGLLLLHYLYGDDVVALWDPRVGRLVQDKFPDSKLAIGVIKDELQRLAHLLRLPALARILGLVTKRVPAPTMASDLLRAFDLALWPADTILLLSKGEVRVHSAILRSRSPFFKALYEDHDWTARRYQREEDGISVVSVDLRHLDTEVVQLVMRHLYGDLGESLFDAIGRQSVFLHFCDDFDLLHNEPRRADRESLDSFIDFVFKVLSAADELMLDRLKAICSSVLCPLGVPYSLF
jgi:alpha-tubulin suppressor-like RCC1 family protein